MAVYTLFCPFCGRTGSTEKRIPAGAKVRCPECKSQFTHEGDKPLELRAEPSPKPEPLVTVRETPAEVSERRAPKLLMPVAMGIFVSIVLIGVTAAITIHLRPMNAGAGTPEVISTGTLSEEECDRLMDQAYDALGEALDANDGPMREALARMAKGDPSSDAHYEATTELVRQRGEEADAATDRASVPYRNQLTELCGYFPDDSRTVFVEMHTLRKDLRKRGMPIDNRTLMGGVISLMRSSSYTEPNTEGIRSFCSQYEMWRDDEHHLTHDEAIAKMHELRKF